MSETLDVCIQIDNGCRHPNWCYEDPGSGQKFFIKTGFTEEKAVHTKKAEQCFLTADNRTVVSVDSPSKTILKYPFVEGTQFDNLSDESKLAACLEMGKTLAKFHQHTTSESALKESGEKWLKNIVDDFDNIISNIEVAITKSKTPKTYQPIQPLIEYRKSHISKIPSPLPNPGQVQFTHGDFFRRNLLFDDAGQVKAILDFELAHNQPIGIELWQAIKLSCFDNGHKEEQFKLANSFIQGYLQNSEVDLDVVLEWLNAFRICTLTRCWEEKQMVLEKQHGILQFVESDIASLKFFWEDHSKLVDFLQKELPQNL